MRVLAAAISGMETSMATIATAKLDAGLEAQVAELLVVRAVLRLLLVERALVAARAARRS